MVLTLPIKFKKEGRKLSSPLMCSVGKRYEKPFPNEQVFNSIIILLIPSENEFLSFSCKDGQGGGESQSVFSWKDIAAAEKSHSGSIPSSSRI